MRDQIYFTSQRFQIDQRKEEETNPGCFGKELANWLGQEMKSAGYHETEVIPEDQRPLTLDDITWSVFPVAEIPFYDLKGKFRKMIGRINPKESETKLLQQLKSLLEKQSDITFGDEP